MLSLMLCCASTIFEFCLPDFTDHPLLPSNKEDLSIPLSLGAICSYWRDIAWSTPSLWSSMVLRVPNTHDSHILTGIAMKWLARSGHLPLSIRIFSRFKNKTLSRLADVINQYSTRWSNLDLYIPDCYFQHFHATDNHAAILKSIRFHCSENAIDLNFQPLNCPRLERAHLSYFLLDGTNIQWDNLTPHSTFHVYFFNFFPINENRIGLIILTQVFFLDHKLKSRGKYTLSQSTGMQLSITFRPY